MPELKRIGHWYRFRLNWKIYIYMPEMDEILIVIVIVSVSVISAEMESINATGIDFS